MKRNTYRYLMLMIVLVGFISTNAQEVGKIDFKVDGFTQKKFNNAEKKVYIQQFFVKYQVMMSSSEIARGGREIGGGVRGDAKASMSLGVKGIDQQDLQQMTDEFYADFTAKLEAAGFTIVSAEEVQKNENFAGEELMQGGTPQADKIPGYLLTTPKDYTYLSGGTSVFNQAGMPQSNKLGGMIVARVNITVPFVENI